MSQVSELFKKPFWKSNKNKVNAGALIGLLAAYLNGEMTSAQALMSAVSLIAAWTVAKGVEDGGKANATARILAAGPPPPPE